ncbi:hypothetical protein [Streptomyces sp. NPDC059247]|uniref:hypothetical protein n=1 Tax=Streptomyces sp. NPDC059247 TaxID=3346790 RepID=UPI0036820CF8
MSANNPPGGPPPAGPPGQPPAPWEAPAAPTAPNPPPAPAPPAPAPPAASAPGYGPPGTPPGPPAGQAHAAGHAAGAGGGTPPPPPAPPGYGPPGYGPPPAAPRGPANPAQAVAVGLLNLSGLGLGYVLLRNWLGAALCWLATAALLVAALPADVDGVPVGLVIGYGVLLLAFAADGARRGAHATLSVSDGLRRLALPLALVLLVVPAGGTLAYGAARDEAKEQALLEHLAAVDSKVKSADGLTFDQAEPIYRTALTGYEDLAARHAASRAGKLVPERLDAYFLKVSAPYAKKSYCEAIKPLTFLRGLPDTFDKEFLGSRPAKTDEPLAESLYECGVAALGVRTADPSAEESLNALYETFPKSSQATKVEPAVKAAVTAKESALAAAACATADELRALRASLVLMKDPAVAPDAATATAAVQRGAFACGTTQFRNKDFRLAVTTMEEFAKEYPSSPQAAHARSIAIAAEIAEEEPEAGKKLPPADVPGGSRMVMVISNDGPGSVEVLYTGPTSGRVTLKACGTCTKYYDGIFVPRGGKVKACSGPSSKYPKATLLLPAGNYQFLQKRAPTGTSSTGDTKSSKTKIEPGYSYTNCLYVTAGF